LLQWSISNVDLCILKVSFPGPYFCNKWRSLLPAAPLKYHLADKEKLLSLGVQAVCRKSIYGLVARSEIVISGAEVDIEASLVNNILLVLAMAIEK